MVGRLRSTTPPITHRLIRHSTDILLSLVSPVIYTHVYTYVTPDSLAFPVVSGILVYDAYRPTGVRGCKEERGMDLERERCICVWEERAGRERKRSVVRGNTRTCQIYHSARCIGTLVDRSLPTLFNFPCSVRINKRSTRAFNGKKTKADPPPCFFSLSFSLLNYRAEVARDERVCAAPPRYTFFTRDCASSLQQVYMYMCVCIRAEWILHFSRGIGLLARKRSLDRVKGKGKIGKKVRCRFPLFREYVVALSRCVFFFPLSFRN